MKTTRPTAEIAPNINHDGPRQTYPCAAAVC